MASLSQFFRRSRVGSTTSHGGKRKGRLDRQKRSRSPGFELLEPRTMLATTVFSDGFEGAFPGNWVVGNNSGITTAKWGDNNAKASAGSYSAFCADNGSNSRTTYDSNLNTYMQRQNVSLIGYTTATLTFKLWLNSEQTYDTFQVNVYSPSTGWVNKLTQSGNYASWTTKTINMDQFCGQSGIKVGFDFVSDGSVVPSGVAGAWVDEVSLTADSRADLALTNLTVSPSTVTTKAFTGCSFNIVNNGPGALSSEGILVEYYLSDDTTFGDADDYKIGDTGFSGVSIASGATYPINLSSLGLTNMTRAWPDGKPNGNRYVFAKVSISDGSPSDISPGNDYDRTDSTINVNLRADLALTNLTVSPSTVTTKAFTACSFNIVNNGPVGLGSEGIFVEYYLSDDTTFGDADDYKIGDTGFTVSIASGATYPITLSSIGLSGMVRAWPGGKPDDINYYVFAKVSISDGSPSDPTPGNDYDRTDSSIFVDIVPNGADLALTNLTVSPSTVTAKAFTGCSFNIVNNGPVALSSESIRVDYYLSDDMTFGDADDYLIGDTGFTVSIAKDATYPITLTSTGLTNMTRLWPDGKPNGNRYVFAKVSITDGSPSDPTPGNDYDGTDSTINVNLQADLALTNLTVSPSTVTTKAFTACSFNIVNNGPVGLGSEGIFVEYYLSDDTTFGDADDYKIGDTGFTGVSIASGATYPITLSSEGRNNMVRAWPDGKPDDINYYVFAKVSISDGSPSDPTAGNDYDRTDSPIFVNIVPDPVHADLALTSLTVSPSTVTTKAFTGCSYNIVNNGPVALSSEYIMIDYYLSDDMAFGDADDYKIGDTGFTVSIGLGATYLITLTSTGLSGMVRMWPDGKPDDIDYYVFAKVSISDGSPSDPTPGNDYDRTDSPIFVNIRPDSDTTPPTANLAHPVNGGSITLAAINTTERYIDVTFSDTGGSGLNLSTIVDAGAEFTLSASGVTVNGAPSLQSGSTYRYLFTGDFSSEPVNVNFTAGSFADNAGNVNEAETERFTVGGSTELDAELRIVTTLFGSDYMSDGAFSSYNSALQVPGIYYAEVWLRDRGTIRGISGGTVDITYTTSSADATAISHGGVFTALPSGTINDASGQVDNLGGGTFGTTEGTTQWVRFGYVTMNAAGSGTTTFALGYDLGAGTTNPQFSEVGVGNVPWSAVAFTGTPVTVQRDGGVDVWLVPRIAPSLSDTSATLPASDRSPFWQRETCDYFVEVWVRSDQASPAAISGGSVNVTFSPQYAQAIGPLDHGAVFTTLPVDSINNTTGVVSIGGGTLATDKGDNEYVLLGRIKFRGIAPVNEVTHQVGPYNMTLADAAGPNSFALVGQGNVSSDYQAVPTVNVRAVIYDIDDSGTVDFGDFSYFVPAFGRTVGGTEPPYKWWADFDGSGVVDFGDFSYFVTAFGKSFSDPSITYPTGGHGQSLNVDSAVTTTSAIAAVPLDTVSSEIQVELRIVTAPASSDRMNDVSFGSYTSVTTVPSGSSYYAEVWLRDMGAVGISGGTVDLAYTTANADATAINHGGVYNVLTTGEIDDANGLVDNLGGGTFNTDEGAAQWVRLGITTIQSTTSGDVTFTLGHDLVPGSANPSFAEVGTGNVDWSLIQFNATPVTITVNKNVPPVLAPIGNKVVGEQATLTFTATATDEDDPAQTLTYSLDPAAIALGMSVDPATGVFTWTPTEAQGGASYLATITVTDNGTNPANLSDSETITVTAGGVNVAPELAPIGNKGVDEQATLTFTASATDDPTQTLTYSLDAAATALGMSIDAATGVFTWTPTEAQGGQDHQATVTVTDNGTNLPNLSESETITITVNEVNVAAVLAPIGNKGVDEQGTLTFTASATDQDDPAQTLTYSLDAAAVALGMSIDPGTGVFTWTPTEARGGQDYQATVTVTDNGTNPANLTDSETITITVNEVNAAAVLTAIGNKSVDEQATLTFTASAADQDLPAQTLTYGLDAAAVALGMSIDPGTGVFTWTPTEARGGQDYQATVTVTDNGTNPASLTDSETITITVNEVNAAPVLTAIGNKSVDEQATLTFTASATDQDDPAQSLTYSLDPAAIALGMSIDPVTGVFTWTPTETRGGQDYPATISVTDNGTNPANLTDSETITITVNEVNVAPVLKPIGPKNVDEQRTLTFTASATDQDVPAQTLTYSLDAAAIALGMSIDPTTGVITWTPTEAQGGQDYQATITVTDGGANPANLTGSETITITVNEVNVAPVLGTIPDESVPVLDTLTFTASATDQDLPAQTLTFSLDAAAIGLGMSIDPTTGVFTWTPTEAQGEQDYQATITVTDNGTNPANLTDSETFTITVTLGELVVLPDRETGYSLLLRRNAGNLELVDAGNTRQQYWTAPLDSFFRLTIRALENKADTLTVDYTNGPFVIRDGVRFDAKGGATDALVIKNSTKRTAAAVDSVEIAADHVAFNGTSYFTQAVENVTIVTGAGNDTIAVSDLGTDVTLIDSAGRDFLDFSRAGKALNLDLASTSAQTIFGADNVHTLTLTLNGKFENVTGTPQADFIIGNSLANRLDGGDGDDTLEGGPGNDTLLGAAGNDTYLFDADRGLGTDRVIELPDGGADTLDFSPTTTAHVILNLGKTGRQTLVPGRLSLRLSAGNVIEGAIGTARDDILMGNVLANVLNGGPGNDILVGAAGDDILGGDDGRDILFGGSGRDTLRGGAGDDLLFGGMATCFNEQTGRPDPAARAVMSEWRSSHSYADRVKYVFNGGDGRNGRYRLKGKDRRDAAVDTLYGDGDQDWYLVHTEDLTPDHDPLSETKTAL